MTSFNGERLLVEQRIEYMCRPVARESTSGPCGQDCLGSPCVRAKDEPPMNRYAFGVGIGVEKGIRIDPDTDQRCLTV
jgi:hypothetical protein